MKLSWKIVLTVLLIVTLTVSVSSYIMIASTFQAELDSQAGAASGESQMLCLTLGALASQAVGSGESALLEQLEGSSFFQNYAMLVYRSDGTVLWKNREEPANLTPADVGQEGLCYAFFQRDTGSRRYLETVQRLELNGEPFYVDLLQGADQAFSQRDANLQIYRQVMLLSVAACTLASIACAAVLTGPIRKLSRSTRSIAGGQYSHRVKVRSRDELGALAEDFNRMADALELKFRSWQRLHSGKRTLPPPLPTNSRRPSPPSLAMPTPCAAGSCPGCSSWKQSTISSQKGNAWRPCPSPFWICLPWNGQPLSWSPFRPRLWPGPWRRAWAMSCPKAGWSFGCLWSPVPSLGSPTY